MQPIRCVSRLYTLMRKRKQVSNGVTIILLASRQIRTSIQGKSPNFASNIKRI